MRPVMTLFGLGISRRSLAVAAALIGTVSLVLGAHAALNKRALDGARVATAEQADPAAQRASRIALVIGNGHYPDASLPLTQPVNDARARRRRCATKVSMSTSSKTPAMTT